LILSFHPCYEADANIICAGREPDRADLEAIRAAAAVILPQGCREGLYRLARRNCAHVFPNYDARFNYSGKTGQAKLFKALDFPHPRTWVFEDAADYYRKAEGLKKAHFPLVFKLDWGGEGDTVSLLQTPSDLNRALSRAEAFEQSGQHGFILQKVVPNSNRTLRVAVIGQTRIAYWRVQDDPAVFGTSMAGGARVDITSDPDLREKALNETRRFCQQSQMNLAGIDFIYDGRQPLILEVNYFFGRTGLGGSDRFYDMLVAEVDRWLAGLGLSTHQRLTNTESQNEI
jgi:ribosomal protein S6--L-glutamate ligase